MKMFRRSKKAQGWKTIMKIVLIMAILFISLWLAYEKFFKTGKNIGIDCNNDQMRCACFYRNDICPDNYALKDKNSPLCPLDNKPCDDDNYESELDLARKASNDDDDNPRHFGTCCTAATSKVSPTRLKSYEGSSKVTPTPTAKAPSTTVTTPNLPDAPAVINVDWQSASSVDYRFDRNTNTWQYNGGLGWGNVEDMGSAYVQQNRVIADHLVGKTEAEGYSYFRTLESPALESLTGVPE